MFRFSRFACTAILVASFALPAAAQDKPIVDGPRLTWKIGLWGRPRVNTSHAEALKRVAEARTGGKWTVILGYDSFGSPRELPDLVKVGALQAMWITASYYPDRFPLRGVHELPFLPIYSIDTLIKVHEAVAAHPAAIAEAAQWGATDISAGPLPAYEIMGRGKPPLQLADWKGLRIRAIGGMGDAMRRLGAVPTSFDSTEVYSGMERGTVDGVALPTTVSFGAFRIYEVAKWLTVNLALGTTTAGLLANTEALNKLPPQYRALIDEAREAGYEDYRKGYDEVDKKNWPIFKAKGIQTIKYTDEQLAEIRKTAAEPVWEEWVKTQEAAGRPGREILDIVLKTAHANGGQR